jgi:hypothetical protein
LLTICLGNGGLGFSAYTIGTINAISGVPNALFQIIFLGRIIRRFGPKAMTVPAFCGVWFCILLFPVENYFARQGGSGDWRVAAAIIIHLISHSSLYAGYGLSQLPYNFHS